MACDAIDIEIGRRVRRARVVAGLSQSQLALRLGLSFQQVQKYEKGLNRIGAGRLYKIARILGVKITYFFDDVEHVLDPKADRAGTKEFGSISDRTIRAAQMLANLSDENLREKVFRLIAVLARRRLRHGLRTKTAVVTATLGNSKVLERQFGHWWVDAQGAWNFWGRDPANDPEDWERAAQSFRRFALDRPEMVQVTLHPKKAEVEFDLHRADDTALDATVEYFAAAAPSGQVELRFFHQAWNFERHANAAALASRMQEVRKFRDVVLTETVSILKRPLSAQDIPGSQLRDALRLAERRASKLTLVECAEFSPYLLIYRRDDRRGLGHWVSLHAGGKSGAAWVFGPSWVRQACGRPYQIDEPGRRYSLKVMEAYAGVLDTGEPRLDHIRAIMRRPGRDPLWVPYERLLFRAATQDGEPVLCCLSAITQDIAIPFLRAAP